MAFKATYTRGKVTYFPASDVSGEQWYKAALDDLVAKRRPTSD
jgi:hypothetical protein